VRAGTPEKAREIIEALTPALERVEPTHYALAGAIGFGGHVLWALGWTEHAASYRKLALNLIVTGVPDCPINSNELTVGRMAALLGDMAEAEEYFERARAVLEASGQRPLRAIVDYDEALMYLRRAAPGDPSTSLRASKERAAPLLDAALAQFRELGMSGWIRRAEGLR
jgi:tetratricopeptide (TPR) repeat protein